jgi:two-component sensor histidine kinase
VTERILAEQHKTLLINELNHRVKNTLATVQALAFLTFRRTRDTAEALPAFQSRLVALAAANDILTREHWDSADIRDIVAGAIAPHIAEGEHRIATDGPTIRLAPKASLALSLALHELCTNATKYGALSVAAGRVTICWEILEQSPQRAWRLTWQESDGPEVVPPARRGFGSQLIEQLLRNDLQADVNLAFRNAGVVCTVEAPWPS